MLTYLRKKIELKRQKRSKDLHGLDTLVEKGGDQRKTKLSKEVGIPFNIWAERNTHL